MRPKGNDTIMDNRVFLWLALAVAAILMVPLVAMQFTSEVNWTIGDFIVAGVLLFGTGSVFVLAGRKLPQSRLVVGVILGAAFLYVWAELAVGVFTDLGS